MSNSLDIQEGSLSVVNVAATVAAVIVDVALRRRALQRARMRNKGLAPGQTFRQHLRRSVKDIYNKFGEVYLRRAYRMKYRTFLSLLATERPPYIMQASGQKGTTRCIPNGPISPDVRLACAIRAYNIMTAYGIGHTDTINSCCWYVVDAINGHPRFKIAYQDDHDMQ